MISLSPVLKFVFSCSAMLFMIEISLLQGIYKNLVTLFIFDLPEKMDLSTMKEIWKWKICL